MEQNNMHIENLLEKFFEGETTNVEEQELYHFFSGENIPEPLKKYKAVLDYLGNDFEREIIEKELSEKDNAIVGGEVRVEKRDTLLNKWILAVSAIAASLVLFSIGKFYIKQEQFNPYEGSYIKRGDVVVLDREEIEAERKKIEAFIEKKRACLDATFLPAFEQIEENENLEDKIQQTQLRIENIKYYEN